MTLPCFNKSCLIVPTNFILFVLFCLPSLLLAQLPDPGFKWIEKHNANNSSSINSLTPTDVVGILDSADIDADGDLDLLISGSGKTRILSNLGDGKFMNTNAMCDKDYRFGFATFINGNADNHIDLIVSGKNANNIYELSYQINRGDGTFKEVPLSGILLFEEPGFAVGDINGDQIDDLVLTGRIPNTFDDELRIYLGTAQDSFSLDTNSYPAFRIADLSLVDLDKDNDLDLFVLGQHSATLGSGTFLFENDGSGKFSLISDQVAEFEEGDAEFADFNTDGWPDLAITGYASGGVGSVSQIYLNDGSGSLNKVFETVGDDDAFLCTGDLNNDGSPDVYASSWGFSKIFKNNGSGFFTVKDLPGVSVDDGMAIITDLNSDSLNEIVRIGSANSLFSRKSSDIFYNLANYEFYNNNSQVQQIFVNHIEHADLDSDNDIDFVLTQYDYPNQPSTHVYLNDGYGNFNEIDSSGLNAYRQGMVLADVDGDNDVDVICAMDSWTANEGLVYYVNDGFGNFTFKDTIDFSGTTIQKIAYADFNADGAVDVLYNGRVGMNYITKGFLNDGAGNFSLLNLAGIPQGGIENVLSADLNTDGFEDLAIGFSNDDFEVYYQDSLGYYRASTGNFGKIEYANFDIADLNGDSLADLLLLGDHYTSGPRFKIYFSDTLGNLSSSSSSGLTSYKKGSVKIVDFNKDGINDFLVAGNDGSSSTSEVYLADTNYNFTAYRTGLANIEVPKLNLFDIDNDHDVDVLISGHDKQKSRSTTFIFEQVQCADTLIVQTEVYCDSSSYYWEAMNCYLSQDGNYVEYIKNPYGCDVRLELDLLLGGGSVKVFQENENSLKTNATNRFIQWVDCEKKYAPIIGENGQLLNISKNGVYAVITSKYGCVDTSNCFQVTGLSVEFLDNDHLFVYPQPAQETIKLSDNSKRYFYKLISISGEIIQSGVFPNKGLDISHISNGFYQLSLVHQKNSYSLPLHIIH